MGFMDKVKDFVAPIEEEDEGYEIFYLVHKSHG